MHCCGHDSSVIQYSHYCQCFVACMTALLHNFDTRANALSRAWQLCYTIFTLLSMLCRVHDSYATQFWHYSQYFVACMTALLHNIHTTAEALSRTGQLCYTIFTLLSILCRVWDGFVTQYSHYYQCFVECMAALLCNIHTIVNALSHTGQLCYAIFTLLSMLCRVQGSFVTQYSHYCQCFVECRTALLHNIHIIVNAL